jgi:hypothetical protein
LTASKAPLKSSQPHIHWASRLLPSEVKRPGLEADHSPPRPRLLELYIHSSVRLQGVELNLLCTGTTLPFL